MGRYVIQTTDEQDAALAWHVAKGQTTADAMVQQALSAALLDYVGAYLASANQDVTQAFLDAPQAVRDDVLARLTNRAGKRG